MVEDMADKNMVDPRPLDMVLHHRDQEALLLLLLKALPRAQTLSER